MSKILPFLSDAGITRKWIDNEDGTFTITESQDLSALLERNRIARNSFDGYTPSRDMQFVGTVPAAVHAEFLARGINLYKPEFAKELERYLDDPDYRGFRVSDGRVGKKHRHI